MMRTSNSTTSISSRKRRRKAPMEKREQGNPMVLPRLRLKEILVLRILPTLLAASVRWTQSILRIMWTMDPRSTAEIRETDPKRKTNMTRLMRPLRTEDTTLIEDLQTVLIQLDTRIRSRR